MATIIQQGGVAKTTGKFEAGFCDCCAEPGGCGRCLYVYCFPCCAAGDAAQKSGGSFCMDCCLGPYIGCHGCVWACTRQRMRQQNDIPGDYCADCCAATFCPCCTLIQELNHIDIRDKQKAVAGAGNVTVVIQQSMPAAPGQIPMGMAPMQMMQPGYGQPMSPGQYPPQQQVPYGYAPQPGMAYGAPQQQVYKTY